MTDDEAKFDVRVRQRLVNSGVLKEAEISKHLEGLRDVGDQAVAVVAKQPALQSESDRDIVIVRTSGVGGGRTPEVRTMTMSRSLSDWSAGCLATTATA